MMIIVHTESISMSSHCRTGIIIIRHSVSLMMMSEDRKYCLCLLSYRRCISTYHLRLWEKWNWSVCFF